MRKFLGIILITAYLFASDSIDNINLNTISQTKLIELEAMNKPIANLILAQAYEIGFPDKGIPKDIEKAFSLYKKVYEVNKDPIAANKLGMYYFTKEVKENKNYDSEKYFIEGINNKDLSMSEFNQIMAGVVYFKKKSYKNAVKYLEKYADNKDGVGNPTAELYLAFTYNEMRQNNLATKYLTRACSNPKSTKDIIAYCNNSVERQDLNKIVEELEDF